MEPQRRTMALRPPMATTPTPTSNNMPPTTASSVATATRTNSLKRTISKCGIDAAMASSDSSSHIAPKKLAPLHDHAFQHQYNMMARAGTASATPNDVYVDDGEPVLLPRYMAPQCDSDDAHASEYSPVAPFGWDGTPQGAKNRYYESVLESTTSYLASPSPQHILYPYTPLQPGDRSTNSTLSFASSSTYSPMAMHDNNSAMAHTLQPPQVLAERDSLSAANLHAIMLSYLEELFSYYDLARTFTFAKVTEMVRSVPFAFRYIQGMVKNRIGLPWHLVGEFVENILDFIGDDDLREASVKEFADFLLSIQAQLYEAMPGGNIFLNLYEFFQNVLAKFKKYLIATWLATQRIQFPCEFGKKSDTLFLCMECHREHL